MKTTDFPTNIPSVAYYQAIDKNPLTEADNKSLREAAERLRKVRAEVEKLQSVKVQAGYESEKKRLIEAEDFSGLLALGSQESWIKRAKEQAETLQSLAEGIEADAYKKNRPAVMKVLQVIGKRATSAIDAERTLAESIGVPFEPSSGASRLMATYLKAQHQIEYADKNGRLNLSSFFKGLASVEL